jgi:trans-aconitate 2-methyltransferase
MATFTDIASRYRETSLVQASAGAQLIELLGIPGNADILDVGCGTGNLTVELSKHTSGIITGIDPSEGMIREASRACTEPRVRFLVMDCRDMPFGEEFDIIFCNSAFQWFSNPSLFLDNAQQVFSTFRPPWFMLETAEAYAALFIDAGFSIRFCSLEESCNSYTPEKVFDVFSSGAKAGYLNPAFYDSPFPESFETTFLDAVKHSFVGQAKADGLIDLLFYRIFLIAEK